MKIQRVIYPFFAFLVFLLGSPPTVAYASDVITLSGFAQRILSSKRLQNATVGFYAVNLNTGQVVRSINPHKALTPASNLKVLTTATALEVLGEEFRFETKIQYTGNIDEEGILHGDLYIQGGGDPTLGSKAFKDYYYKPYFLSQWVQAIKGAGIRSIEGGVIADACCYDHRMIPDTWIWSNLGSYYGAGYCGLSIFDNIFNLYLKTGPRVGDRTKIVDVIPNIPPEVKVVNQVRSSSENARKTVIYGLPYHNLRTVTGTVMKNKARFPVPVSIPDPSYWAAYTLNTYLKQHGIEAKNTPSTVRRQGRSSKSARKLIHTALSPPLKDIIFILNQDSSNLYSEHALNHLGFTLHKNGSTTQGIQALKGYWRRQGVDTQGMFIHDGSGLSRYNAITPKNLVDVLCHMKKSKNYGSFRKSLPIAGKSGSLRDYFKHYPLKGNITAKTGRLDAVLAYTGYCKNSAGDEIAFSLMVNHYRGSYWGMASDLGKLLKDLILNT